MGVFQASCDDRLVDWLVLYLRARQARLVLGLEDAAVAARTRDLLPAGRRLGLTTAEGFARFVVLAFRVSPRFADHPRFRAAFTASEGNADDRLARAAAALAPADWELIARVG